MPQLVLQLVAPAAADLHTGRPKTSAARAIAQAVGSAGGTVAPMHPVADDPTLAGYFSVDLPGGEAAAALAAELLRLPSVAAAYVKPDDALPGR
jgi:hypothetical protein